MGETTQNTMTMRKMVLHRVQLDKVALRDGSTVEPARAARSATSAEAPDEAQLDRADKRPRLLATEA